MNKLNIIGDHEPNTIAQIKRICESEDVQHAVLCADGHLGYSVPVGGVVAYEGKINVNGVGFDIACGNKAVLLDIPAHHVRANIKSIMDEVAKTISFGMGRRNNERVDHELFDDPIWKQNKLLRHLKDKAKNQLGTVGSGNHYVDIFVDELDRVWVGVHFGSRGLGHTICTHYVKAGGGADGVDAKPVVFDETSDLGEQYIIGMHIAGRYAYAGRDWVCSRVAKILGANIVDEVHNHHNFAWKEKHFGKDYWVVRKGATPAFPGQRGFVGGSMGDISVILEGVESQKSPELLYSTVHGAGRVMGRASAVGNSKRPGLVNRDKHDAWIKRVGVELRGGDLDESPFAYKRIEKVLDHHKDTVRILHTLKPIGVCMAGRHEIDPYKD